MNTYTFGNTEYIEGAGAIKTLSQLKKGKAAIITDKRAVEKGKFLQIIEESLGEAGCGYTIAADIQREPHLDDISQPLQIIKEYQPDYIVALGGGSVIDVAKVLWVFYEHPELSWEQLFTPFSLPTTGNKAALIAIPTTSGTGAETTCAAVLIDSATKRKNLVLDRNIIPTKAILDSTLVETMPVQVAAAAGMDALSHALEAMVSKNAGPMTVAVATIAALDIMHWLPISVNAPPRSNEFKQARAKMHAAAGIAGMAINNSSAGLSHAMDQIGPSFDLPHGIVCGILLPYTVNATLQHPAYTRLTALLGINSNENLVDYLLSLNKKVGLASSFKSLGISPGDYEKDLPGFVNDACRSGSAQLAPTLLNKRQFEELFDRAYHGIHPYKN